MTKSPNRTYKQITSSVKLKDLKYTKISNNDKEEMIAVTIKRNQETYKSNVNYTKQLCKEIYIKYFVVQFGFKNSNRKSN